MNATPLIATVAIAGAGAFWYYSKIHCPDPNMERVDGDCTCMEGYYQDPNDDKKCVAHSTTEAPENKAVLDSGVYVYSPDGEAVDTSDESQDIVIDCLLCKAVEGSSRQAQDGRCLRCQPAATQQKWRNDDDTLDYAGWIADYESAAEAASTPPNPISADYEWVFETTDDTDVQSAETFEARSYSKKGKGFLSRFSRKMPRKQPVVADPRSQAGQKQQQQMVAKDDDGKYLNLGAEAGYSPYNYSPDLSTCVSDKMTRTGSVL